MLPAFGLYTHIQANRRRSAVLIVGLFALFYLMTFGLTALVLSETQDGRAPSATSCGRRPP